jgi:hypothetical protein
VLHEHLESLLEERRARDAGEGVEEAARRDRTAREKSCSFRSLVAAILATSRRQPMTNTHLDCEIA